EQGDRDGRASARLDPVRLSVLANKLFGFKFKVVTGYESTPKIHLAMESGEVHGTIANWSTLKAINTNWITEKKIRILAQWALQKSPEIDDVPLFLDLAKSEAERAALRLMLARLEYGRPFFLPADGAGGAVRGLAGAVDGNDEEPALPPGGGKPKGRRRAAPRRAGRRADRAGVPPPRRHRRPRPRGAGEQVTLASADACEG